jgi:hypothetical protein
MWQYSRFVTSVALACLATAAPCAATTITLDALDSGFYNASGTHTPSNENYLTGMFNGQEDRSFFLFDLSGVSGTVQSATLRLFNPEVSQFLHGYVSPDATETLNLYDVTTSAAAITGNAAGVAGFNDLGSGTLYGTRVVSAADNGTVIEIVLSGAALTDLNAANGLFLFGGALGTLAGPSDQYVFGFSMATFVSNHTRQLVLDVTPTSEVPEPSTLALCCAGAMGLLTRRRAGRRGRTADVKATSAIS